jgi:hypothetical protein
MQYRAFGGLKSLTYGTQPTSGSNTTRTQTYDVRQQIATLQVGTDLSADFQYHSDGQIKYAKDNTDPTMDRAYNYDQVGRLAEGLSGAEARNPTATADGIYRQTYQYDAFSNLTGRLVNRFWSGGMPFGSSYVDNRRSGSLYDADGNVLLDHGSNRTHIYDAASRQVQTREQSDSSSWGLGLGASQSTSSSSSPSPSPSASPSPAVGEPDAPQPNAPIDGYYTTTTLTIAESYDGDGRSLKRVQTKVQSRPFYQEVTHEIVDYYLRSTVLGGQVITELTSGGQKQKTNVYIGSELAAEQVPNGESQFMVWKYQNPVTGTSAEQTSFVMKKEYDPFGLELGDSDPYLQNEFPDYPGLPGGSFYGEGGNPFDGTSGCNLDGFPAPCSEVGWLFSRGFAGQCPNNNCGSRHNEQGWEVLRFTDEGMGHRKFAHAQRRTKPTWRKPVKDRQRPRRTKPTEREEPKYPPVTLSEVNVVYGGRAFESIQNEIVNAIVDIANRQGCSDAFKIYDLTIPYDVVKSGKLRIAGVAALYEDNAEQLLGLTAQEVSDSKTQFRKQGGLFRSGLFATLTAERAYPSVPLAIFNPSLVRDPIFGGLKDVVTHTFIHLGGKRGDPSASPHDLSKFEGYDRIVTACR